MTVMIHIGLVSGKEIILRSELSLTEFEELLAEALGRNRPLAVPGPEPVLVNPNNVTTIVFRSPP